VRRWPAMAYRVILDAGSFDDAVVENALASGRAHVRRAEIASVRQIADETAGADAVIVTSTRLGRDHVDALGPRVRLLAKAGIGVDAIDLERCAQRGVAVFNQPDYATAEVATHAIAMLLALQRRVLDADRIARTGWSAVGELREIAPLHELTLGLVGIGRIGWAVAERARPLVRTIRAYDPHAADAPGIELDASLDDLLAASDIVSLHLPLSAATRHLIDARRLARMRPGSLLVNVSRGGLVDSAALASALAAGALGGAALDVFEHEPLTAGDPLAHSPRTLLSPHVAWLSTGSARRLRSWTIEDVLAYLDGGALVHGSLVTPPTAPPSRESR
jgi:D-3-phosphoglycerate dehydrogenase